MLGMTGFAVMEPIKHTMSTTFASALMKVQLRFGLCHTIVLNKGTETGKMLLVLSGLHLRRGRMVICRTFRVQIVYYQS